MDTGDIAIVATLVVGFLAILIAQFTLMRVDSRETRSEIRELSDRLGTRVSEVELKQARDEGANKTLSDVLKQQSHTHEVTTD